MPYTAINIALLVALVFTCGFSFAMLREFRRFKAHAGEYGRALHEAAEAMAQVDHALARTHDEGARTAITLGERLDAAQQTLEALRKTEAAASAQLLRLRERIHEARDAASEAAAAIDTANDRDGPAAPAGMGGSDSGKAGQIKAGGTKASGTKAGGTRKAPRKSTRNAATQAFAQDETDPATAAQDLRTLALAPAEATAQNAPRTRKILSWPVIRSAGMTARA
ncbi:MAG: hypothetical protein JJU21_09845 [Salinarimonas sp.]|nr:hypothetical protein [Salinarimonas sp.]